MKTVRYGMGQVLTVSNDVANVLFTLSTELANARRMSAVPVAACEGTVQVTIGIGVMLLVADAAEQPESAETLRSWSYMRDELEALQSEGDLP